MIKNILFPTDFSDAAMRAFIYALHFADKYNATITTLYVYKRPEVRAMQLPRTMAEFRDTFDLHEFKNYKDAIPPLKEIAEQNGFGHVKMQHVLEPGGSIVSTILEVARRDEADLIIMGTTGARGLKEIFLGSVAGEVIENAECPVLAVPEENTFDGEIDRVGFSTAYSETETKALLMVEALVKPFDPEIFLVHIDTSHTEDLTRHMQNLESSLTEHTKVHFRAIDSNDFLKDLTGYLEEQKIDMIAMVTQKRTFLESLFNYSKTKQMSYHSKVPVLSIQKHLLEAKGMV